MANAAHPSVWSIDVSWYACGAAACSMVCWAVRLRLYKSAIVWSSRISLPCSSISSIVRIVRLALATVCVMCRWCDNLDIAAVAGGIEADARGGDGTWRWLRCVLAGVLRACGRLCGFVLVGSSAELVGKTHGLPVVFIQHSPVIN